MQLQIWTNNICRTGEHYQQKAKLTDEARAQGEGFDKLDLSAEDAPVHLLLAVFTARDMLTKPRFINYCYFLSSHFPKASPQKKLTNEIFSKNVFL